MSKGLIDACLGAICAAMLFVAADAFVPGGIFGQDNKSEELKCYRYGNELIEATSIRYECGTTAFYRGWEVFLVVSSLSVAPCTEAERASYDLQ